MTDNPTPKPPKPEMTQHVKDFIMWMGIGVGVYLGLLCVIMIAGEIMRTFVHPDNPFNILTALGMIGTVTGLYVYVKRQ